jgi:hypothetical protein
LVVEGGNNREFLRSSIVALVPRGGLFVTFQRVLHVTHLQLIYLSLALLVGCGSSKISLAAVLLNREVEAADGRVRLVLSVDLEGINESVRRIVWLLEVGLLDFCCFLKRCPGIDIYKEICSVEALCAYGLDMRGGS